MASFGQDGQWESPVQEVERLVRQTFDKEGVLDLDALLDPDRVGMAVQGVLGGLTVPRLSQGWPEQWPVLMRELVRKLREGVSTERPSG